MHFENFELSNLESDEGVFEALSTPDLKIFYPEPFIASPSFSRRLVIPSYFTFSTLVMVFLYIFNYVFFHLIC
jgi:hypothetical protein